jgi:hypothetical protein
MGNVNLKPTDFEELAILQEETKIENKENIKEETK